MLLLQFDVSILLGCLYEWFSKQWEEEEQERRPEGAPTADEELFSMFFVRHLDGGRAKPHPILLPGVRKRIHIDG